MSGIHVMPVFTSHNSPVVVRIMVFIDSGYFTEHFVENELGIPRTEFNFDGFIKNIAGKNGFPALDTVRLIRTYYYDGLPDPRYSPKYKEQKQFHGYLNYVVPNLEVRTGRLIKTSGMWQQKGVDTILALDMIDKAYTNQYDVAILIAGDLDHLPAVENVKSSGKEVYGVYYAGSFAQDLVNEFDLKHSLNKANLQSMKLTKPFYQNYLESLKK